MRVSMLKMMMNHGSHWDIGVEENAEFYGSQISRPSKLPQVGDNFGRHILGVMNSLMQVRTLASYLCGVLSNENHGRFESAKDLLGGFQQTEMMGMDQISMAFLAGWSPQKLYGFMQKNTTNLGDVFLPLTTKAVPSWTSRSGAGRWFLEWLNFQCSLVRKIDGWQWDHLQWFLVEIQLALISIQEFGQRHPARRSQGSPTLPVCLRVWKSGNQQIYC